MAIKPGALSAAAQQFGPTGDTVVIDNYIPEIWSGKLLEKFYAATVFGEISNTDYEGEIKSHGDTVHIRVLPDITINDYSINQELSYERPAVTKVDLLIDHGKYYGVSINKVEEKQADIAYVNKWAEDASDQMKISIETGIFADIYDDPAAANKGATAGVISGNINLGVKTGSEGTSTAIQLTKTNIIDKIVECGQVLDEQNIPQSDRWIILPAWAITRIKSSELRDASITGDSMSILRNGKVGSIDRFTVYSSNLLFHETDALGTGDPEIFYIMFGHKKATTFASQLTENELIPNPADFGKLMRGLQVYGYKVLLTNAIGVLCAYAG